MKKGDRVEITDNCNYYGQDMSWTETPTHMVELKKGDRVYHRSTTKLTSFVPKETCFYSDNYDGVEGYIYCGILQEDTIVQGYSNDSEIRIDLSEVEVEMYYIGTVSSKRVGSKYIFGVGEVDQYEYIYRTIKL